MFVVRPKRLDPSDPRAGRVLLVGVATGVALIIAALCLAGIQLSRLDWVSTDGVVVDVGRGTSSSNGRTSPRYTPTVRYEVAGRSYTVKSHSTTSAPIAVGDPYPARYDPDDPARGAAGTAATLWIVAAGLAGMAVLFVALFGGLWWHGRRQRADPSRSRPSGSQPSASPAGADPADVSLVGPGPVSAHDNPRVLVVVSVIFGVLGVAALVVGGVLVAGAAGRADWPTTQATVTAVSVTRGSGSTMYQPRFTYEVDGREYPLIISYSSSERVVVGEQRTVQYDPADPGDAVLDGAGTLISTVLLLVGLVTLSIVVTVLVRTRRPSRR